MRLFRVIGVAVCVLAAPVHAHTHLEKSVPADGSTLQAAPPSFVLTFAKPVKLTALSLQRGSDPGRKLGPLPADAAAQVSIPAPKLADGTYVLSWRAVGDDGHVMPGKLTFTVHAAAP